MIRTALMLVRVVRGGTLITEGGGGHYSTVRGTIFTGGHYSLRHRETFVGENFREFGFRLFCETFLSEYRGACPTSGPVGVIALEAGQWSTALPQ